ncbi:MAG: sulfatase [Alphaproteobacteria bacterium]|nr:sulfatase [Alphaproteobacteria bacterium]
MPRSLPLAPLLVAGLAALALPGCSWFGGDDADSAAKDDGAKAAGPAKGRKGGKAGKAKAPEPPPPPKPPAPDGPNVLLIVWDTTRADHLSLYGYDRPTTPRLEAFAKDAVVYDRVVSPGMWTLPSHSALFTGLPVSAHGANSGHKWLDGRFTTMAEAFRDTGYDTYLFSANPYLGDHTNMGQGFETREFPWDAKWKKKAHDATFAKIVDRDASNSLAPQWKETTYKAGRSNDKTKDAGLVTAEALFSWIDSRPEPERPWFGFLNYMETHVPRVPSMESRKALFDDATIDQQLALDQSFGFLLAYTMNLHEYTPEQIAIITSTYDAAVRDLDAATGGLLDQLAERGELDDTIVVITADHGEHLGEHHRIGHKFSVYQPLVHVPLVIRYPKKMTPAHVAQVVSNLSVFATVAELAGVPLPAESQSKSLLHLDAHPDYAVAEMVKATPQALMRMDKVHDDFDHTPFQRTYKSIETADAKCIRVSDGTMQLYAEPGDPLEAHDLAPAQPERAETLCARIDDYLGTFPAYDPKLKSADDDPDAKMDAATKARLMALGYLDEREGDGDDGEAPPSGAHEEQHP